MIFVFSIIIMISIWSLFFWFLIVFLGFFVEIFIVFNSIIQIKFIVIIIIIDDNNNNDDDDDNSDNNSKNSNGNNNIINDNNNKN